MKFEVLSQKHLGLLFQFELENRQWFESLISSRGDHFYTRSGVKKHIDAHLTEAKLGNSYSGVLLVDDKIVARGNLKDICSKKQSCSVGYRVAKNSIGRGYSSYCLTTLIKIANTEYSIDNIEAKVLENNPASQAVLKKAGFTSHYFEHNFIDLHGNNLSCTTYKRTKN